METPENKTGVFEIIKNYLPAIIFIGGLLYNIFNTWDTIKHTAEEIKDMNLKFDHYIEEQKIINDKEEKDIEETKDWIEYKKGFEDGKKEKKPG
jgi:hypothetical protein